MDKNELREQIERNFRRWHPHIAEEDLQDEVDWRVFTWEINMQHERNMHEEEERFSAEMEEAREQFIAMRKEKLTWVSP